MRGYFAFPVKLKSSEDQAETGAYLLKSFPIKKDVTKVQ